MAFSLLRLILPSAGQKTFPQKSTGSSERECFDASGLLIRTPWANCNSHREGKANSSKVTFCLFWLVIVLISNGRGVAWWRRRCDAMVTTMARGFQWVCTWGSESELIHMRAFGCDGFSHGTFFPLGCYSSGGGKDEHRSVSSGTVQSDGFM